MRIRILWVGRTRNPSINDLCLDYLARARRLVPCDIIEVRDFSKSRSLRGAQLIAKEGAEMAELLPEDSCRIVVLAEKGKQFSSPEFARWFDKEQNQGTRNLCFIIGGPGGVSEELVARSHVQLSLGKMTWTHEMSRFLLLEQIYRAFSILRNIPYQK